jgi:branched-chain amino acid transport system substrate-binding protein
MRLYALIPFLSLFAAWCLHADDQVITLVSSFPRTGSANAQSTTMANAIRLALAEAGDKLQVGTTTYRLTYEDWDDATANRGAWDAAVETANANNAINNPDVMVYIGTYDSGAAKVVMPMLNTASMPMISPANTWPGLTKPGIGAANEPDTYRPSGHITYFRVVPADDIQGEVAAKWAASMGVTSVFILHNRELYGQGLAKMFKLNADKLGLQVVGFEGIDGHASNYKSLVTKIRQSGAQLVYFGGTTQTNAGQIAKDLVGGGLDVKFMVPDGCFEKAFISAAGPACLEGRTFITFGGVPPQQQTGRGKVFVDQYIATYHANPEGYAIYAYECAKVALDAMQRAGRKDRAAICAALAATKDFHGALGTWSFDANGDTTLKVMSGNTVTNGDFAFVKLLGQ